LTDSSRGTLLLRLLRRLRLLRLLRRLRLLRLLRRLRLLHYNSLLRAASIFSNGEDTVIDLTWYAISLILHD
jgi:hypothetical protein